jgi:YegS/Rv2252/BmrU family lipid kinase
LRRPTSAAVLVANRDKSRDPATVRTVADILLIANANAGSGESAAVQAAVEALRSRRRVDVVATRAGDELDAVIAGLAGRDLVVAGGDGSLHAAVDSLYRLGRLAQPTIALIPLGTGNDFARGLRIPLDPVRAAAVVLDGRPTGVDILLDDKDGVVVNVAHAGVGADAGMEARPFKARLGRLAYVAGALIAAVRTQGHLLQVRADDQVLADGTRRVLQVGIGNGPRVGGGTRLAPDADPTDGLADVLVSFAVKPLDRLLYGVHLRRGTHDERHDVRTVQSRKITVSGQEFCCDTDGELAGPMASRTWNVLPQAFTMMLPTPDQAEES